MRIIIENTVCLNAGDAAIMLAIMKILRESFGDDVEFTVFDSDPEISAHYYNGIAFRRLTSELMATKPISPRLVGQKWATRIRRNIERVKRLAFTRMLKSAANGKLKSSFILGPEISENIAIYMQSDFVVTTGGTYLVEHYDFSKRLFEFEKDFRLGKPLVFFTQSLGPYQQSENRKKMKAVVEQADLVLLRDEKSKNNLIEIGVTQEKLEVVADSVFALADIQALTEMDLGAPRNGKNLRVAISVRDWAHFEGRSTEDGMRMYKESVSAAIKALVNVRKAEVVFLSTCQGIAEYQYDDSQVAQIIWNELDEDVRAHVSVDNSFNDPESLMKKVRTFDFVISTRMHMAILSMGVGVPVLPISYEFKTTELYSGIEQSRWVTDISEIDPARFSDTVLAFAENLSDFRATAMPRIRDQSLSAQSAGALTLKALERQLRTSSLGMGKPA
jgi:colanic acid/amylovoran biosynthesis protein